MERKWASNMLLNIIQSEIDKLGVKINLDEDYKYWHGIDSHRKYLEKQIKEFMLSSDPILITCFSKKDDKLSQWRAYGQDGYGVAIGFDLNKIRLLQDKKNNINVKDVIYNEKKQVTEISKAIKQSVKHMKELFNEDLVRISDDFNEYFTEEFDAFCEVIVDKLEPISCYIKNSAFIEEEEIRIIYDSGLYSEVQRYEINRYFKDIKKVDKYKINPIRFCSKNDMLVAYSDINFNDFISENIITEIVLGPKSRLKEDDVFYFLLSNGYDGYNIEVRRSKATYR